MDILLLILFGVDIAITIINITLKKIRIRLQEKLIEQYKQEILEYIKREDKATNLMLWAQHQITGDQKRISNLKELNIELQQMINAAIIKEKELLDHIKKLSDLLGEDLIHL